MKKKLSMNLFGLQRGVFLFKFTYGLIFIASIELISCANFGQKMKSFLGGGSPPSKEEAEGLRYSKKDQVPYGVKRKYGRMTREKMEQDAGLDSQSGSLWVMEGQGAYFFSENTARMIGDYINVHLDGAPLKQLETKVMVIQKLLKKLEHPEPPPRVLASSSKDKSSKKSKSDKGKDKDKDKNSEKSSEADKDQKNEKEKSHESSTAQDDSRKQESSDLDSFKFEMDSVPSRIIERLSDGNYRVKGTQSLMIGKKEYRVIVSGIVRADDFKDEGVNSSQLLDPKFDIVSLRRSFQ